MQLPFSMWHFQKKQGNISSSLCYSSESFVSASLEKGLSLTKTLKELMIWSHLWDRINSPVSTVDLQPLVVQKLTRDVLVGMYSIWISKNVSTYTVSGEVSDGGSSRLLGLVANGYQVSSLSGLYMPDIWPLVPKTHVLCIKKKSRHVQTVKKDGLKVNMVVISVWTSFRGWMWRVTTQKSDDLMQWHEKRSSP